jgi:cell division transport system permease protein
MLVLIGFLLILFVISVFIILNTVKLSVHARKQEIVIMRYIGATNFFIVFPFLLEGIIIGIVSAVLAYIAQSYIYNGAVAAILGIEGGLGMEFIVFSEVNIMLFTAFAVTGVACGFAGSGLSSRQIPESVKRRRLCKNACENIDEKQQENNFVCSDMLVCFCSGGCNHAG